MGKPQRSAKANQFMGFVDGVKVSPSDLAEAEERSPFSEVDFGVVEDLLDEGYSMTLKKDRKTGAYVAQLFGQYTAVNKGFILASFSGGLGRSVALTLYKHQTYFDEGAWELESEDQWG